MNRNTNQKSISEMNFSGSCHSISVVCKNICEVQEIETESEKWKIRNISLSISSDDEEYMSSQHIIFTRGKTSVGFPVNTELNGYNRFYSTYYIKKDENYNILPLSMIIDTPSANIHRNDLGDNEKSIKDAYDKVKDFLSDLFWFMCAPEITAAECINEISDIFHSVLCRYINQDNEQFEESPFNLEGLDNQYLPKIAGNSKTDVVVHEAVENYQKYTPLDKNSVAGLTEIYFKFIEKENVTDYDELVDSDDCIEGVGRIYRYLYEDCDTGCENYESALRMLHFFPGVAEYITYVVSGEYRNELYLSDLEVDQWLCELKNEHEDEYSQALFLKLIGRYYLSPALKFDGTLQKENLSFRDYLFNGLPELKYGLLSNWQNEQYDSQYAELKRQVSGNRFVDPGNKRNTYKIRYIEPKGISRRRWDGIYDYYGHNIISCEVSSKNKLILLEKLALDGNLLKGIAKNSMRLYEKQIVSLRRRDKFFDYYYPEREQQIICLDF